MSEEEIRILPEIAEEVMRFANMCLRTDDNLLPLYRDLYLDASLRFIDSQKIKIGDKSYSLFPERLTQIRRSLELLKTERSEIRERLEETFHVLRRYSPDFKK